MKSFLFCVLSILVSAKIDGPSTLYPGYVVNYETPKNSEDIRYAFLPVVGITASKATNLTIGYRILDPNPGSNPTASVRIQADSRPTASSDMILTGSTTSWVSVNTTNELYFLSVSASCSGSLCDGTVDVELSAWTPSLGVRNWPPYELLDQRRTAKFSVDVLDWLYFWLAVTDDRLSADLRLKLYIGVNFYQDGSGSGIQALAFPDSPTWPTGTQNVTDGALYYFPINSPIEKGNWIMDGSTNSPPPFILSPGLYQICFFNPVTGHPARFTTKVGFGKPPTQAANVNASFNLLGLIALSLICIAAQMKHL